MRYADGDVVMVEPVAKDAQGSDYPDGSFGLRQIPEISGAMVAMDPHTGRVLAMTGGWSYPDQRVRSRHPGACASRARPSSRSSI